MTTTTTWPARRFYWAVVDPRPLPRGLQRSHEQHRLLLEPHLPVPLADVHAAFAPCADGRLIGCAIECETLRTECTPEMRRLIPDAIPAELGAAECDACQLNLLTGAFEPAASRRAGRLLIGSAVAAMIGATTLLCIGHARRTSAADARAHAAYAETAEILTHALDRSVAGDAREVSLAHRELGNRLSALRQSRDTSAVDAELLPADLSLATFLAAWPREPELVVQVKSIDVSPMRITCSGDVNSSGTPSRIKEALDRAIGWSAKVASYQDQTNGTAGRTARRGSSTHEPTGTTTLELTRDKEDA